VEVEPVDPTPSAEVRTEPEIQVEPAPVVEAPPPVPSPETSSAPIHVSTGRPVDVALMKWVGRDLGSKKKKDITRGQPYKINLYQDDGNSVMNRAKVDLDRDERWDEKWTIDGQEITRKVAPADDEDYTQQLRWDGAAWQET